MTQPLPSGVRLPLAVSHARSDERLFGVSTPALGTKRRRRLFRSVNETATVQWRIPHEELARWNTWYEATLQAGSLTFAMPLQSRLLSGRTQTVEARFAGAPRMQMAIGWATITADVVVTVVDRIVTSQPYPIDALDGLALGLSVTSARLSGPIAPAPEGLALSLTIAAAHLSGGTVTYSGYPDEALTLGLQLSSANLAAALQTYGNYPDEAVTLGLSVTGAELDDVLLTYGNYPDEAVTLGLSITSATLS